jgi:hypothetical protein
VEKWVGLISDVTTDKDRPRSWREGGGSEGGGGTAGAGAGDVGRDVFSAAGLAGFWSSAIVSRAGELRGASRRLMRLLKKPESLLEDRTCERGNKMRKKVNQP